MRRCRRLLQSVQQTAQRIVDEEQRQYADPATNSKLHTDLADGMLQHESVDPFENEREEHEIRTRASQRFSDWENGHLKAGSREQLNQRDERMYQEGSYPTSQLPPHPPNFDEIVRKVRYAHLMPVPVCLLLVVRCLFSFSLFV